MFARYSIAQDKKKAELAAKAAKNAQIRKILTIALIFLLFLAVGGTGYYYSSRPKPASQVKQSRPVQVKQEIPTQVTQETPPLTTTPDVVPSPAQEVSTTKEEQKTDTKVEIAGIVRQTIVSIDTSWGTCTGFFIKDNLIITSKYMMEFSSERYKEYINEVEQSRELLEQEAEELQKLIRSYQEMDFGTPKDELAAEIDEREMQLNNALLKQQEREDQLKDIPNTTQSPEIVIYLPNGSEVQMINLETSGIYDLALLSVDEANAPPIELSPEETSLKEGDTVYSFGPGNKVIKGTFTQYHQTDNPTEDYLQTDAQISSKYNGAPLVDEKGYVYGVSTTTLINEDGVGSAIPIATVFSEFNL